MSSLWLALILLGSGSIFAGLLSRTGKTAGAVSLASYILALPLFFHAAYGPLIHGASVAQTFYTGEPFGTLRVEIDSLSAFFVIIIAMVSFLAAVYQQGAIGAYLKRGYQGETHFALLGIMTVSMIMVVVVRNVLAFLIAWEVMSVCGFFLVTFEHELASARKAAVKYMVYMHVGVVLLITAFLLAAIKGGSLDFSAIGSAASSDDKILNVLFLLFFCGFAFKAGFVPFHAWAPQADSQAPRGVSAVLSGVVVKMGIYGILRVICLMPDIAFSWLGYFMLAISAITALYGILNALMRNDMTETLAYSTVENVGVIGIGISVGLIGLSEALPIMSALGFGGALFHILNHSIFKALLFFGAGSVYNATKTCNINNLGGVLKKMPVTGTTFLIAAAAASALPPLNGFAGEFLIYLGLVKGFYEGGGVISTFGVIGAAALALTGALTLSVFAKTIGVAFLGAPRTFVVETVKDSGWFMLAPMIVLAGLCVIIGVYPAFFFSLIRQPVGLLHVTELAAIDEGLRLLKPITLMSALTIALSTAFILIRGRLMKTRAISKAPTWGCGYKSVSHKMQYTGDSIAATTHRLASPIIGKYSEDVSVYATFPSSQLTRTSTPFDSVEKHVNNNIWLALKWVLDRFKWIQSGHTEHYLLYILATLILLLIVYIAGVAR